MNPIQPVASLAKPATSKRARQACLRCYKQKLRCDNERPCALCTRSSMECKENIVKSRRARTSRSNHNNSPSFSHNQVTSRVENLVSNRPTLQSSDNSQFIPSDSGLLSPASLGKSELSYEERPSTYPLVNHMFEKYNSAAGVRCVADAIPDGRVSQKEKASPNIGQVSVFDLVGMDLPPREITTILLNSYLKSTHWFIMVIHEPTFRTELDGITTSGTLQQTQLSFVALTLVILAFGSKHISDDDAQSLGPEFDRHGLERALIRKVDDRFLDICESGDIESVQTGLLLSAYHVYFGKPKRASIVYDATLTCAKALGLHKESSWGEMDSVTREIRRRVWWAVYAGDGFSAVNFGRPCSINDRDWEVKMVCNIGDTSITCPGFQSMETLEDGSAERVTILSYRRCKYKLYQIVSTILKSVYFTKDTTIEETAQQVKAINERLLTWERQVPPELKLMSFRPDSIDPGQGNVLATFQLQALALHLFYNNIQLLLHRPLLTYSRLPGRNSKSIGASPSAAHFDAEIYKLSKAQCWESAMQTTKIGEFKNLLLAAQRTLVAPYIGIQSFTAGAVLGLFALSAPLTTVSQEAKRALGRIIRMPQSLGFHNLVSDQCGNILKELVHLILSEEMRSLTSDVNNGMEEQLPNTRSIPPERPPSQGWDLTPSSAQNVWPNGDYDRLTGSNMPHIPDRPQIPNPIDSESIEMVERDMSGFVYGNDTPTYQDCFPATAGEDFNHALLSLQNAFGEERFRTTGHHQFSDEGQSSMNPFPSAANATSFNADTAFDDTSQSWIWGDNFNFR